MPVFLTFQTEPSASMNEADSDLAPGKDWAVLLERGVASRGIAIVESVDDYEGYGWEFIARVNEIPISCLLQLSDEWMAIVEPKIPLLKRITGAKANSELDRFCAALHEAAVSNPAIRSIQWFPTESALRSGKGMPQP